MAGAQGREKGKARLIPEGELPCIWMEAGLVSYKLCEYQYECEGCPFDAEMKKGGSAHRGPARQGSLAPAAGPSGRGAGSQAPATARPEVCRECFFHPGHTWARPEGGPGGRGTLVRVGVDDFAARVLPRVKDAILPPPGHALQQGHVFSWIVCSSSTLPILAPVSGRVVGANPELAVRPQLINADPRGAGWLVLVEPGDLEGELALLLRGRPASSWMANEQKKFERLAALLGWPSGPQPASQGAPEVGATLADGGERFLDLNDAASVRRYFEFIARFFL